MASPHLQDVLQPTAARVEMETGNWKLEAAAGPRRQAPSRYAPKGAMESLQRRNELRRSVALGAGGLRLET